MKVIFLDIEGVLNTSETYDRAYQLYGSNCMIDLELDNFRLEYLKTILEETGAQIVLSSSFRYFFSKRDGKILPTNLKGKKIYDTFNKFGIKICDTISKKIGNREEQIKEWLSNRDDIESFVIIDDDSSSFYEFSENLVLTNNIKRNYLSTFMKESTGLCEKHVDKAINILNKKEKVLRKS